MPGKDAGTLRITFNEAEVRAWVERTLAQRTEREARAEPWEVEVLGQDERMIALDPEEQEEGEDVRGDDGAR